jgi:hypothetical protein
MKTVELYARVRHAVLIEGIGERAAADRLGINARTVSKMLKFSVLPGYVRSVFGAERLTGALLDRLTHHVHILETGELTRGKLGTIPETAKTENTRPYQGGLWLGFLNAVRTERFDHVLAIKAILPAIARAA